MAPDDATGCPVCHTKECLVIFLWRQVVTDPYFSLKVIECEFFLFFSSCGKSRFLCCVVLEIKYFFREKRLFCFLRTPSVRDFCFPVTRQRKRRNFSLISIRPFSLLDAKDHWPAEPSQASSILHIMHEYFPREIFSCIV